MRTQMMRSLVLSRSSAASASSTFMRSTSRCAGTSPFLQQVQTEYAKKTQNSAKVHAETTENFIENSTWTQPIVTKSADGARITDVDGNTYIDMLGGYGSNLLGHNNQVFTDTMNHFIGTNTYHVGTRSPDLKEATRLLAKATGMDKTYFFEAGTKANHLALRVARASRKKVPVVLFNGSWHGQSDSTLFKGGSNGEASISTPGIPEASTENVRMYDWGSEQALQALRDGKKEIAAVMVDPAPLGHADKVTKEYLQALRNVCDETGIILIFDELSSGFRMALGGAQEYYGVKADIATYGKALCAGIPVGVMAGKESILSIVGSIAIGGTFCSNSMQVMGTIRTLKYLEEHKATLYPSLEENMAFYCSSINEATDRMGIPIKAVQRSSIMRFDFDPSIQADVISTFILAMRSRGVYYHETDFYGLGSVAHTREVYEEAAKGVVGALTDFNNAGVWAK